MTLRFQPLEIATNSADRDGQLVFSGDLPLAAPTLFVGSA